MYKKRKNSWDKHYDFIILDTICLLASFLLACLLYDGDLKLYHSFEYRNIVATMMILHICVIALGNHYSGILRRGYYLELKAVIRYNMVLMAAILAYLFIMKRSQIYSRKIFLLFFVINVLLDYVVHQLLKCYLIKTNVASREQQYMLLVTTKNHMQKIVEKLKPDPFRRFELVGIVVLDEDMMDIEVNGVPVVANANNMYEYACYHVVDSIFLDAGCTKQEIEEITNHFLEMGIVVHISLSGLTAGMPNAHIESIRDVSVVTTSVNTAYASRLFIKRVIDICAGLVGCFITGLLTIVIGPLIYIKSPGPIFFTQMRVGKNGRKFKLYKFRTMYLDAEERKAALMEQNKMQGLMFKMDHDPRIIGSGPDGSRHGLGYFLRTLSLDEFPNFINILKGDMSLVGTRPPTVDEYQKYDLHHKRRLAVKPGLTGMWQVSGRSDITDFEEVVKLDGEYIKNWSLKLDVKIILKTILVVFQKKGAV